MCVFKSVFVLLCLFVLLYLKVNILFCSSFFAGWLTPTLITDPLKYAYNVKTYLKLIYEEFFSFVFFFFTFYFQPHMPEKNLKKKTKTKKRKKFISLSCIFSTRFVFVCVAMNYNDIYAALMIIKF